jgi:hypothetical protein
MCKKCTLCLLLMCLGITVFTQAPSTDSLKKQYNNFTIYRYGTSFMKGGDPISFSEMSKEFSMSDIGLVAYQKAVRYKKTSTVLSIASIALGIGTIATVSTGNNNNLATGLLVGQLAFSFGSMKFKTLSNQSLDRAIWQRNKDLLFPPAQ